MTDTICGHLYNHGCVMGDTCRRRYGHQGDHGPAMLDDIPDQREVFWEIVSERDALKAEVERLKHPQQRVMFEDLLIQHLAKGESTFLATLAVISDDSEIRTVIRSLSALEQAGFIQTSPVLKIRLTKLGYELASTYQVAQNE